MIFLFQVALTFFLGVSFRALKLFYDLFPPWEYLVALTSQVRSHKVTSESGGLCREWVWVGGRKLEGGRGRVGWEGVS